MIIIAILVILVSTWIVKIITCTTIVTISVAYDTIAIPIATIVVGRITAIA